MKAAIVILSDPKNGLEESAGRAFNALSAAYDFKWQGEDVTILFQGAGTRWIDELTEADHPFPVPGCPGLPSLQKLTREGYTVLSF